MSTKTNIFWLNDFTVLYKDGGYTKIIPIKNVSRAEQLNAITRFCICYIILLLLVGKSNGWIFIPIIIILFTIFLYFVFENDEKGKTKDFLRLKRAQNNIEPMVGVRNRGGDKYRNNRIAETDAINDGITDDTTYQVGQLKSDNNLTFGKQHLKNEVKNKFTMDEMDEYQSSVVRQPTRNNPFMNITLNDIGEPDIPEAANADDDEIKDKIEESFNDDLFRNVDDLFNIKNSQRQFYTTPATSNPPDTKKFANWLYLSPTTCKDDQERCLRYEDLRFNR